MNIDFKSPYVIGGGALLAIFLLMGRGSSNRQPVSNDNNLLLAKIQSNASIAPVAIQAGAAITQQANQNNMTVNLAGLSAVTGLQQTAMNTNGQVMVIGAQSSAAGKLQVLSNVGDIGKIQASGNVARDLAQIQADVDKARINAEIVLGQGQISAQKQGNELGFINSLVGNIATTASKVAPMLSQ